MRMLRGWDSMRVFYTHLSRKKAGAGRVGAVIHQARVGQRALEGAHFATLRDASQ
jgi:hypothetical protein